MVPKKELQNARLIAPPDDVPSPGRGRLEPAEFRNFVEYTGKASPDSWD